MESKIELGDITPLIVRTREQIAFLRKTALENNLPENIYEDFGVYANYMIPKIKVGKQFYDWAWFHWYMCKNFNNAIFDTGTLLTVEIGPQVGKSLLTALFITFVFGVSPDTSIVYATYNENKAVDFTKRYVIKFMGTDKYKKIFPHISLKYELDKKDGSNEAAIQRKTSTMKDTEFTLSNAMTKENYSGGYRCYGLNQGIHGVPADIFIIDDYVDKADSVRSENFKTRLKEWFYNDMPSRLQDNSTILIGVCTRWYKEDIIGMLHSTYFDDIVPDLTSEGITPPKLNQVKIRAEYRESDNNPPEDPRTRNGEYLWRVHVLKYAVAKKGQYFQCVYNCDTSELDSSMQIREEHFGWYSQDELPDVGASLYISMDGASTTGRLSDHSCIGLWLVHGRIRYLLFLWYVKMEVPELTRLVIDILTVQYPQYRQCLIEFANSGIPVTQTLKEMQIRHIPLGFSGNALVESTNVKRAKTDMKGNTNSHNTKRDRYLRIIPEVTHAEKRVRLPLNPSAQQAPLIKEFVRQMVYFNPDASHGKDDMVDMAGYLIHYTAKNIVPATILQKKLDKPNGMSYNLPKSHYFMS